MISGIQRRIELSVTNGLGYDSETDFRNSFSVYSNFIKSDEVKNSEGGLRAHLRKLSCPEVSKYGREVDFVFSGKEKKDVFVLSRFGKYLNESRNRKVVDLAYDIEARKRGKANVLFNGLMRKFFGYDVFAVLEFLNER